MIAASFLEGLSRNQKSNGHGGKTKSQNGKGEHDVHESKYIDLSAEMQQMVFSAGCFLLDMVRFETILF